MGNQRIEPVSPKLLLSLWRERWGKASSPAVRVPYSQGKLTQWGDQLTDHAVWSIPGTAWVTALCCLALFLLTVNVVFTPSGQVVFTLCLAGAALYLRRYEGMLMTLMLASLSLIASARYFDWRLSSVLNLDYTFAAVMALGLCLAELYFWIVTALGFVTKIWPLKRASAQLPADTSKWPTVDIYIPTYSESMSAAQEATTAALALAWPTNKLTVYLLDDHPRAEMEECAKSNGVKYLVLSNAPESNAERIHLAASQTNGALIALLDCHQRPDPRLLEQTVGWFAEDLELGMIQTPNHCLAPEVSENCLSLCSDSQSKAAWALVRRAALMSVNGTKANLFTNRSRATLNLGDGTYHHSMVGFVASNNLDIPATNIAPKQQHEQATDPYLVDDPFSKSALHWKQKLIALQNFLDFYYLLPLIIFLTAPLAYLLGGFDVIQATPEVLLAYFVPHILYAYFATERLDHKNRLTLWIELRETLLAWYFLVPTAFSLLRTKILKTQGPFSSKKAKQTEPFDRLVAWPFGFILGLSLLGVLAGFQYLWRVDEIQVSITLMYLVWALYNLMLLAATFAVAEESRQIRQHIQRQLQHQVMLQLPSGRTMTGVTQNFPNLTLVVHLPVQTTLEVGMVIGLSIFRGQKEFTFSAQVAVKDDQRIQLAILANSQSAYQALGILTLSRDERWPQWLPGTDADQPLTKWVVNPFLKIFGKFSVRAERWRLLGTLSRLGSRIKYWKNTT